jgi:decaprenylphospho-beta-D-ribofuranose 2-oxidase
MGNRKTPVVAKKTPVAAKKKANAKTTPVTKEKRARRAAAKPVKTRAAPRKAKASALPASRRSREAAPPPVTSSAASETVIYVDDIDARQLAQLAARAGIDLRGAPGKGRSPGLHAPSGIGWDTLALEARREVARGRESALESLHVERGGLESLQPPPTELWSYDDIQSCKPDIESPDSVAELIRVLTVARASHRRITVRGAGHAIDAQSLNDDLVVRLEERSWGWIKAPVQQEGRWTITVGSAAPWGKILEVTSAVGLVPFVVVSSSHASAGGTLSSDCLSRFSPVWGREGLFITRFHLITMDLEQIECARDAAPGSRSAELFNAAIDGLGYLGVVTDITYELRRIGLAGDRVLVETELEPMREAAFDWAALLDKLARASRAERARFLALSPEDQYGFDAPAADVQTAYATVWFMPRAMEGMILRSRYVRNKDPRPLGVHEPARRERVAVEWMLMEPHLNALMQDLFFKIQGAGAPYVDDLHGYTFFMDGNTDAKRAARSLPLGLSWRMTLSQQTFVVPVAEAASFLVDVEVALRQIGLPTTLFDILYLPADDRFLLSSTNGLEGFAITLAFEDRNGAHLASIEAQLFAFSELCLERGGRVQLTKTVRANKATLATMYAPRLAAFRALKATCDATGALHNAFFDRVVAG